MVGQRDLIESRDPLANLHQLPSKIDNLIIRYKFSMGIYFVTSVAESFSDR